MTGYDGLNAVVYARVSTDDKGQDPTKQIGVIKEFCEREGIAIVKNGVFIEEKSGKDLDRPQFQSLIGRVVAGMMGSSHDPKNGTCKVDLVVAWTQSRISRDTGDFIGIKKQIESFGARFLFVDNPTDTTNDDSEILLTMTAAIAQAERKRISKNVKMGIRQAQLNGKWVGRPKTICFMEDLEKIPKGALRFDDNAKKKTKVITESECWEAASNGWTVNRYAKELGVAQPSLYVELKRTGRMARYQEIYEESQKKRV